MNKLFLMIMLITLAQVTVLKAIKTEFQLNNRTYQVEEIEPGHLRVQEKTSAGELKSVQDNEKVLVYSEAKKVIDEEKQKIAQKAAQEAYERLPFYQKAWLGLKSRLNAFYAKIYAYIYGKK
jgi:hypothetical protein